MKISTLKTKLAAARSKHNSACNRLDEIHDEIRRTGLGNTTYWETVRGQAQRMIWKLEAAMEVSK